MCMIKYLHNDYLAKSLLITTPSTDGPKALKYFGGSTWADSNNARGTSRKQSTIDSCSRDISNGGVQLTCLQ